MLVLHGYMDSVVNKGFDCEKGSGGKKKILFARGIATYISLTVDEYE